MERQLSVCIVASGDVEQSILTGWVNEHWPGSDLSCFTNLAEAMIGLGRREREFDAVFLRPSLALAKDEATQGLLGDDMQAFFGGSPEGAGIRLVKYMQSVHITTLVVMWMNKLT